jgi:hypothetical protein
MNVSDIFRQFDSSTRFNLPVSDDVGLVAYSGIGSDRWIDSKPEGSNDGFLVGLVVTPSMEGETWRAFLDRYTSAAYAGYLAFLAHPIDELPINLLMQNGESTLSQIVTLAPLAYERIFGAVVALRTPPLRLPTRWLLPPENSEVLSPSPQNWLRLVNEKTLEGAIGRLAVSHLDDDRILLEEIATHVAEHRVERSRRDSRRALAQQQRRHESELVRLRAALTKAQERLDLEKRKRITAQEKLRRVRQSTPYRFGELAAATAHQPLRQLRTFPQSLIQIRKDQRVLRAADEAARSTPDDSHGDGSAETRVERPKPAVSFTDVYETRLRIPSVMDDAEPQIGRIGSPVFGGERLSAWQFELHPDTALDLVESRNPNVLLVDSSAVLPGSTWVGAGSALETRLDQLLRLVVETAQRYGTVTVLRWDTPVYAAQTWRRFQDEFDVVVRGASVESDLPLLSHGVNLGIFHPACNRPEGDTLLQLPSFSSGDGEWELDAPPSADRSGVEIKAVTPALMMQARRLARAYTCAAGVVPSDRMHPLHAMEVKASAVTIAEDISMDADQLWRAFAIDASRRLQPGRSDPGSHLAEMLRSIYARHSTISELRSLGRLTGVAGLAKIDSVVAVVRIGNTIDASGVFDSMTESAISRVAAVLIVQTAGMEDSIASRVAGALAARAPNVTIVTPGRSLEAAIANAVRAHRFVWLIDRAGFGTGQVGESELDDLLIGAEIAAGGKPRTSAVAVCDESSVVANRSALSPLSESTLGNFDALVDALRSLASPYELESSSD